MRPVAGRKCESVSQEEEEDEEDYERWPANKPCLASFIYVKLNVSDRQTDIIHWHHKPRQMEANAKRLNQRPHLHMKQTNHQNRVSASCATRMRKDQSEKVPISSATEAVGLAKS